MFCEELFDSHAVNVDGALLDLAHHICRFLEHLQGVRVKVIRDLMLHQSIVVGSHVLGVLEVREVCSHLAGMREKTGPNSSTS